MVEMMDITFTVMGCYLLVALTMVLVDALSTALRGE